MKINFTKKEYRNLVEMLLIADWVLTGHEVEPREETKPDDALRKKVLSHYKETGMEGDIEVFWDLLANRLAERDFAAEVATAPSGPVDEEARVKRLFELTECDELALSESGLDGIRCIPTTSRVHCASASGVVGGRGHRWSLSCLVSPRRLVLITPT